MRSIKSNQFFSLVKTLKQMKIKYPELSDNQVISLVNFFTDIPMSTISRTLVINSSIESDKSIAN